MTKAKKKTSIYSVYFQPTGKIVYYTRRPKKSEIKELYKKHFMEDDDLQLFEEEDFEIYREELIII